MDHPKEAIVQIWKPGVCQWKELCRTSDFRFADNLVLRITEELGAWGRVSYRYFDGITNEVFAPEEKKEGAAVDWKAVCSGYIDDLQHAYDNLSHWKTLCKAYQNERNRLGEKLRAQEQELEELKRHVAHVVSLLTEVRSGSGSCERG